MSEKITVKELEDWFGTELPTPVIKILFPEKSKPLTLNEARGILEAMSMFHPTLRALKELDDALNDGLCNSGTPGFDSYRLDRASKAARKLIDRAEGRNHDHP